MDGQLKIDKENTKRDPTEVFIQEGLHFQLFNLFKTTVGSGRRIWYHQFDMSRIVPSFVSSFQKSRITKTLMKNHGFN